MRDGIAIGLLDSGLDAALSPRAVASCRFRPTPAGGVDRTAALPDVLGHGSALAGLILAAVPEARLINAQIFADRPLTSAALVADGLAWLRQQGARLVNMSIGLVEDRPVLRDACAEALAGGLILVAPVPALGGRVYPAAYPGVIRVTGDARCQGGEIAAKLGERADFGANPWRNGYPQLIPGIAGASVATARITAALGCVLAGHPDAGAAEAAALLRDIADHLGPQRPGAEPVVLRRRA